MPITHELVPGATSVSKTYLLVVVEVDKQDRVLCQAEGCGHSIFKRIHVMKVDNKFQVLGSECFKRLYGHIGQDALTPRYGSSDGRTLTNDERQVLIENTERFIEKLEIERAELLQAEVQRRAEEKRQHLEKPHLLNASRTVTPTVPNDHFYNKQQVQVVSNSKLSQVMHQTSDPHYLPYDGMNGLRWMWARSLDEGRSRIERYKSGEQRIPEKDLIVRYFIAGSRSDPWAFSLGIQHHCSIPTKITLSVLHEMALIEPLPSAS
jgi:hypothetical protein